MASENEIPLVVTAEIKDASTNLKKLEGQVTGSVENIEKSLESLKTVGKAVVAFLALEKLVEGLADVIHEAAGADQAVRDLAVSLAGTGEFSDEAVVRFKELADSIEATTTVTDDAVLKGVTLAKSFGLTNDQAEKLVKTAVDLSAATGTDLNTAVEQLGATFSGTAGRLAKTTPQLKLLTEEQLRNGEAVDILQKKYVGFAAASTQTFSGALTQTGNAFDQILKGIGQVITQNPVVIEAIKVAGEVFKKLSEVVSENQESITQFVSRALKGLVSFLPTVIKGFTLLVAIFQEVVDIIDTSLRVVLALGSTFLELTKPIRDIQNVIINGVLGTFTELIATVFDLATSIPGVGKALEGLGVDVEGVQNTLDEFGTDRLTKAFTLDTSASDSFQKFANESLDSVNEFSAQSREKVNGFLESVGQASANLIPEAEKLVNRFDKLGDSLTGVTKGINNVNSGLNATADIAKRLEELKGSFDKVKGAVEPLQQEIDKLTLSQNKLIDAEFERNTQALANATEELGLQGKLKGNNLQILEQFGKLIVAKRNLAKEKLTIGDFTVGELVSAFQDSIGKLKAAFAGFDVSSIAGAFDNAGEIFSTANLVNSAEEFGQTLASGLGNALDSAAESFSKVTLKDIGEGFSNFVVGFANQFGQIVSGIISGQFISQALSVFEAFAKFPDTILQIFTNAGKTFADIAKALPQIIDSFLNEVPTIIQSIVSSIGEIINKLVDALPAIGQTLANAIGDILTKIAEKLPQIVQGLIDALQPLIATIFERVLPALIKALPGVVRALANAIAPILKTILQALPEIIKDLAKAIPEIVRALADALPGIIEVLAENIGPVVEALVEGLITLMPDIVIALVDSLLINGGLERIIKAIIIAIPRIAGALVLGIVHGLGSAALAIGQAIGRGFVAIGDNLGNKIGGDFSAKVSGGFNTFIANIKNAFSFGGNGIFGSISSAFSNGAAQLFANIGAAFQGVFGGLFATIQNAFGGIFGGLFATIQGAFQSIFGQLFGTIVDAFSQMGNLIFNAIKSAGTEMANIFGAPVQRLIDFLNNFSFPGIGGGGGNGNILTNGTLDPTSYFATGGRVTQVPTGYPNDSFPARLTSNELVVDQGLTKRLENFLYTNDKQGSQGTDINSALLNKILACLEKPQQVSTSVVINGRELANAILDLQRNNSRLSA